MKINSAGRRVMAVLAMASVLSGGIASAGVTAAQAVPTQAEAGTVDAPPYRQFEFAAKWTVTLSCYFENLDRTDATGPKKYTGTGKTKDLAEKDAWNKAQGDAPHGRKVKHCRTESSSKK